jgi:hypothetical protein
VPAIIVFAALQFLGPLQLIDWGLTRETIILVVASVGRYWIVGTASSSKASSGFWRRRFVIFWRRRFVIFRDPGDHLGKIMRLAAVRASHLSEPVF